jgi:hypothetical protein
MSITLRSPQLPSTAETATTRPLGTVVPDIHTPYHFYERIYLDA